MQWMYSVDGSMGLWMDLTKHAKVNYGLQWCPIQNPNDGLTTHGMPQFRRRTTNLCPLLILKDMNLQANFCHICEHAMVVNSRDI